MQDGEMATLPTQIGYKGLILSNDVSGWFAYRRPLVLAGRCFLLLLNDATT